MSVRVPKRIIHCSDGVIEEFSSSESEDESKHEIMEPVIDPVKIAATYFCTL